MKNPRICVIGLGTMGRLHVTKLLALSEIEVIGVENEPTRKTMAEKDFHISVYENISEIMGNIDGAIVATPTSTHFEIASQLIKNGVHTFIEKPMAENSTLARRLMDLALKNNVVLQVGHIERFNPSFNKLKKFLKKLRAVVFMRMSPFPNRSLDIDVVMDLMIHDIDLLLSLQRSEIKSIESTGYKIVSKSADIAMAKLRFSDGMTAHLVSNRVYDKKVRKIIAIEKKRYFIADLLNFKLTRFQKNGQNIGEDIPIEKYDMIEAELSSFVDSVVNKKLPPVTAFDGYRAIRVAEKIQKKMLLI